MKSMSSMFAVLLLLLGLAVTPACSKKVKVDTVNLEYSFQTADDKTQSAVTEAINAIDKADYTTAQSKLQAVAANPKLTTEQKTAVNGVLQQLGQK